MFSLATYVLLSGNSLFASHFLLSLRPPAGVYTAAWLEGLASLWLQTVRIMHSIRHEKKHEMKDFEMGAGMANSSDPEPCEVMIDAAS